MKKVKRWLSREGVVLVNDDTLYSCSEIVEKDRKEFLKRKREGELGGRAKVRGVYTPPNSVRDKTVIYYTRYGRNGKVVNEIAKIIVMHEFGHKLITDEVGYDYQRNQMDELEREKKAWKKGIAAGYEEGIKFKVPLEVIMEEVKVSLDSYASWFGVEIDYTPFRELVRGMIYYPEASEDAV